MKHNLEGWHVASVAAPKTDGPYYRGWTDCMTWCQDTFGKPQNTNLLAGEGWRYVSEGVFEFSKESDCALFLLKWS